MVRPTEINKEHHLSRNGPRESIKKQGGGKANWGTWKDELEEYSVNEPFLDQERHASSGSPSAHVEVKPREQI